MKTERIVYSAYCDIIRQKIHELMVVDLTLEAKGLKMDSIMQKMRISDDFFKLIPQIQNHISLKEQKNNWPLSPLIPQTESEKHLDQISSRLQKVASFGKYTLNPLVLANLASEITANFITIFDFFTLEMKDSHLLEENFNRIQKALKEFPGMDEIYLDFKTIIRKSNKIFSSDKERDLIYHSLENLYHRFLAILKSPNNLHIK
ncbi:MAG: hypothetical protein JW776_06195 [Candidatus Lokiarchaeota archaeon]|nr:hypothetical protein [Candidatus Lokiarchaeota archaeon]